MTKKKRGTGNSKRGGRKAKEEADFIVESIVDRRVNEDGVIEYYLKWKDYGHEDNTWEPAENCACPELIEAFEASRKKDLDIDLELTEDEADQPIGKNSQKKIADDSETESELSERPKPASRKMRATKASFKDDTTDEEDNDEDKGSAMEIDRPIVDKDLTLEDSDDSLDFNKSKYYNKENDASKIQPEFEVEEDDDDKRDPPKNRFDEIIRKTASSITSSTTITTTPSNEYVAEKVLKAGLLKDGKIHFIIKLEGVTKPQRYEAEDAYKLFPQAVISYFQTRIRWQ